MPDSPILYMTIHDMIEWDAVYRHELLYIDTPPKIDTHVEWTVVVNDESK